MRKREVNPLARDQHGKQFVLFFVFLLIANPRDCEAWTWDHSGLKGLNQANHAVVNRIDALLLFLWID